MRHKNVAHKSNYFSPFFPSAPRLSWLSKAFKKFVKKFDKKFFIELLSLSDELSKESFRVKLYEGTPESVKPKWERSVNLIKQLHRDYTLYLINTIYSKVSFDENKIKSCEFCCFLLSCVFVAWLGGAKVRRWDFETSSIPLVAPLVHGKFEEVYLWNAYEKS